MARDDLSIEHLAGTSALLNGVAIPGRSFRSLESALGGYAFNVSLNTNYPRLPVILRGAGTALKFRGSGLLLIVWKRVVSWKR